MAKHRRQDTRKIRRIATASAVAAGAAAVVTPVGIANAATVTAPGTNFSVEVPGLENVQGIQNVPGIQQWVPELSAQQATNYNANVAFPGGSSSQAAPATSTGSVGQQIVNIAQSKIGAPYVYGAAGPQAFDCSGFTSWVYAQVGKFIPRTSQAQAGAGTPVAYDQLQPGDIVAFYSGASHVGIYIGGGQIIDALNSSSPVAVRSLDMMPFHSAVRF